MFDESRYRAGAGGGAHEPGRTAAQPARVSQRATDDRLLGERSPAQVFVVGANASTLALIDSANGDAAVAVWLLPLAWTPIGVALGDRRERAEVPLAGLYDWIDRTFPADQEQSFVASMRDLELLVRIGWTSSLPDSLSESSIVNVEDLPDELVEALARSPVALVQCAACRRLCVRDDFVWKEKQLCAWDFHAQVFGKRGPWREGSYEERHFASLPGCAYVVPELLAELGVELLMTLGNLEQPASRQVVDVLLQSDPARAHMAVSTESGFVVLREA